MNSIKNIHIKRQSLIQSNKIQLLYNTLQNISWIKTESLSKRIIGLQNVHYRPNFSAFQPFEVAFRNVRDISKIERNIAEEVIRVILCVISFDHSSCRRDFARWKNSPLYINTHVLLGCGYKRVFPPVQGKARLFETDGRDTLEKFPLLPGNWELSVEKNRLFSGRKFAVISFDIRFLRTINFSPLAETVWTPLIKVRHTSLLRFEY